MNNEFAAAFVAAQAELTGVSRDATNPQFRAKYATLEAVTEALRPVLAKHGLAYMQMPGQLTDQGLEIRTVIFHRSGANVDFTFEIPLAKRDPQGAGSAITYACRYALMAAFGLPPTDDDGEAAMDRGKPKPATPRKLEESVKLYLEEFQSALGKCDAESEVRLLWDEQTDERKRLGIAPGTQEFRILQNAARRRVNEINGIPEAG